MKAILLTVIPFLLLASCGKRCDDSTPAPEANSWRFMSESYRAGKSVRQTGSGTEDIIFLKADTATYLPSLTFQFRKFPAAAGTYKIVTYPRANDEVSIYYLVGDDVSGGSYRSDELAGARLEVQVLNGKLRFYAEKVLIDGAVFIGAKYERADLGFNLTEF